MYESNTSMNHASETAEAIICVGRELLCSVQAFACGLERRLSEMECYLACVGIEEEPCDLRRQLVLTQYEHYVRSSIEGIYLTTTQPVSGELSEIEGRQLESARMFGVHAVLINESIVVHCQCWEVYIGAEPMDPGHTGMCMLQR